MSRAPAYISKLIEGQAIAVTKLDHMASDSARVREQVETLDTKMDTLHAEMRELKSFERRLIAAERGVADYKRMKGIGVGAWLVLTVLGSTLGGLVLKKLGWSA
jgi:hypothetical protein